MSKKDIEVLNQIKTMLSELEEKEPDQYEILLALLQEVFLEYNSNQKRNIEKKLYDLIDGKSSFKLKTN